MIRQALADFLLSKTAITDVVGQRVRPVFIAQSDTFPAIVYRRISAGHNPGIEGGDDTPSPQFQVTSWAETYGGAVSLNEIVRGQLENEGEATWPGDVEVLSVTYIDEQDTFDENTEGGDKPLYGVQAVYEIMYRD